MIIVNVPDENVFEAVGNYRSEMLYGFSLSRQKPPEFAFLGASLYLERNTEIGV